MKVDEAIIDETLPKPRSYFVLGKIIGKSTDNIIKLKIEAKRKTILYFLRRAIFNESFR